MFGSKDAVMGIKSRVFSIYDKKGQVYFDPFCARYNGEAARRFEDIISQPNSAFAKHAADFSLWCLGVFDTTTGILEGFAKPEFVAEALDYAPAPRPEKVLTNGGV